MYMHPSPYSPSPRRRQLEADARRRYRRLLHIFDSADTDHIVDPLFAILKDELRHEFRKRLDDQWEFETPPITMEDLETFVEAAVEVAVDAHRAGMLSGEEFWKHLPPPDA